MIAVDVLVFVALVPVVLGAVLAAMARRAATRLDGRAAAIVLVAASLSVALATGIVLSLLAAVGVAETVPDVRPADWSLTGMRHVMPLSPTVELLAGAVVLVLLTNALRHAVRVVGGLRRAHRTASRLPSYGGLAIAEDDAAYAYAVPGRPGRIVVSTGLLATVSGPQRRAIIEHERSHLRHRHAAYSQLGRLAAAANPLLRPVVPVVDAALERWADEDATRCVGDARIVAHAIGAVSLAAAPAPALGAAGSNVVDRVRYLVDPPVLRRRIGWLLAAAALACWVSVGAAGLQLHAMIEFAEHIR